MMMTWSGVEDMEQQVKFVTTQLRPIDKTVIGAVVSMAQQTLDAWLCEAVHGQAKPSSHRPADCPQESNVRCWLSFFSHFKFSIYFVSSSHLKMCPCDLQYFTGLWRMKPVRE